MSDLQKSGTVKSLSEITADRMISHIVSRGYKKGDKIANEMSLCEELGVGRSTLREAVRMLASRNILTVRHGSGIYISDKLGIPDDPLGFTFVRDKKKLVYDLLGFRRIIEPPIAALAAANATEDQIVKLEEIEKRIESQINSGVPHLNDDAAFHSAIGEMSGNIVMPKIGPIIYNAIDLFINVTGSVLREETISDHRAVIDAIKSRNSMLASDSMLLHIIHNREVIERIMESGGVA
jgi:GntR family transcriptional repressor for pyruvate dehydrogenase complex